ncbi:DMT family transporter [Euzebyella saccharophila]|uniref:DMT family transporter n=1 Tax=Euzebyella saccharophila TaxID=679664 RepID=A0ABV8JP04_9FLAO|nr:DMT family transporter [Euzebyella saccharophila]
MSKRNLAILAALGATTIYGLNHTIAKGIMPNFLEAYALVELRVIGATLLFWLMSFFGPKEKIEKRDYLRLVVCAILGMGFNMLTFFKGLSLSTPINSAVLMTTSPIIVLILSVILIKEKVFPLKIGGIIIGLLGALTLIFLSNESRQDAPNIPLGNILILMNATFYGGYLITAKSLIEKYHPFTFMKWLFLLGIFICLPFSYQELVDTQWNTLTFDAIWRIAFVIIGTTFFTYLFNIFALTQLKASTVSAFVYLQPLIGIIFALVTGQDQLTTIKIAAACLVFLGVYLASKKPNQKNSLGKI